MSKKANLKVEVNHAYTKLRSQFGKKPFFSDRPTEIFINIPHNEEIAKTFSRLEFTDKSVENIPELSCIEVNTTYIEKTSSGINHIEGGWPKDINSVDAEQTSRYRKKAEKEENYVPSMLNLCKIMESVILENNALNIYEDFFYLDDNLDEPPDHGVHLAFTLKDYSGENRSVASTNWHPTDGTQRIAVAHCCLDFQMHSENASRDSYIWHTTNHFVPETILKPKFSLTRLEFCYKEPSILAGGQINGQICFFDIRRGQRPVESTYLPASHRDPITDLIWIQSKSTFECFTTSTDGQVLWWDMRNLNEAADQMCIDPTRKNSFATSEGGTCLEYEPTIPTRFMVGTEAGKVFSCTRRARLPQEKIGLFYDLLVSPVRRIQRSPFYPKIFLAAGDWRVNLWSEDVISSPIWDFEYYDSHVMHATWSPVRPFVFLLGKEDGTFDIWDLMYGQKKPQFSLKICDDRIFSVNSQEQGEYVALSSSNGICYVLKMNSSSLEIQKNEKPNFINVMDRETKREKILEGRERERKLAKKKAMMDAEAEKANTKQEIDANTVLEQTCINFHLLIAQEQKKMDRESSNITNLPVRFPHLEKPQKLDVVPQLVFTDPANVVPPPSKNFQEVQDEDNASANAIIDETFNESELFKGTIYARDPEPMEPYHTPLDLLNYDYEFEEAEEGKSRQEIFLNPIDIFKDIQLSLTNERLDEFCQDGQLFPPNKKLEEFNKSSKTELKQRIIQDTVQIALEDNLHEQLEVEENIPMKPDSSHFFEIKQIPDNAEATEKVLIISGSNISEEVDENVLIISSSNVSDAADESP